MNKLVISFPGAIGVGLWVFWTKWYYLPHWKEYLHLWREGRVREKVREVSRWLSYWGLEFLIVGILEGSSLFLLANSNAPGGLEGLARSTWILAMLVLTLGLGLFFSFLLNLLSVLYPVSWMAE